MSKKNNFLFRRIIMIIAFYAVNFGLWELLVLFMPKEWASFSVYAILFPTTFIILGKQLKDEWYEFKEVFRPDKRFVRRFLIFFTWYFLFGGLLLLIFSQLGIDITPQNNENISTQMNTIPLILTIIQICIFAPIIEEMTFRYSIIGKVDKNKILKLVILSVISIILFDKIHIFKFKEFFYYLVPSVALTGFYVKEESVIASIILHSAINVVGAVVLLVSSIILI